MHPTVKEVTEDTYGFLIFQEQIALLAHKLGQEVSLDEGNLLRKLLTKKGTVGKGAKEKKKIYDKFVKGCVKKKIHKVDAEKLWNTFEYFSGYGFNKSHAVSYCVLSYQCAWLSNYYPAEWMAAFLDKEPEKRKERAINIAKSCGFEIKSLDINSSGKSWEISPDAKTLIQPLTSIKGLGESAIAQIANNRPFLPVEDFLFSENIVYSKLNKKALDVLIRSGAMNTLMDERFTGMKHFWSAVAVDRPRKPKNLIENIETYAPEGDFTEEEKIQYLADLTGVFPINDVVGATTMKKLEEMYIPPLGEYDPELQLVWFIPRSVKVRKTKNGTDYWIVEAIDATSKVTTIKCWGPKPGRDILHINKPYMAKLDYSAQWGFSTRSIKYNFKLIG